MAAERYKPLTPFATAFAAEYKGFMKANGITNLQIARKLDRNDGYVSERVNAKRALDTEDVDALAMLVPGWTGKTLMIELARRVHESRLTEDTSNVTPFPPRRDVSGPGQDDEYEAPMAALDQPTWQQDQEDGEESP